jgi:hypothetical protein
MDLERLLAFALMTFLTSVVPGPSVLFVMGQTIWRGARAGWAALIGLQVGYLFWWALAALGLGSLAAAFPRAFQADHGLGRVGRVRGVGREQKEILRRCLIGILEHATFVRDMPEVPIA